MDEEADPGDHQNHDRAERIEQEAEIGGEAGQSSGCGVERQPGEPGELDDLVGALRKARQLPDRASENRKETSTVPGQRMPIRAFERALW